MTLSPLSIVGSFQRGLILERRLLDRLIRGSQSCQAQVWLKGTYTPLLRSTSYVN